MGKKKVAAQSSEDIAKAAPAVGVEASAAAPTAVSATKKQRHLDRGRIYINASYNNTIVTVTDISGNVIAWASSGSLGFSGPKKATPFASSKVIAAVAEKLKSTWPASVEVIVKGVGSGRDSAIRSLINYGLNIVSLRDVTPVPHNGPCPPKVRRV
jgi:small subunit ribosomal protein S11